MKEYIEKSEIYKVIDRFLGYFDDDMIYRIKFKINQDCPVVTLDDSLLNEVALALEHCTSEEFLHPCEECPYTDNCKCETTLHTNILTAFKGFFDEANKE